LKLATTNLIRNLGLQSSLPNTFKTKFGGGLAREAAQTVWDPLLIGTTLEAGDFKGV